MLDQPIKNSDLEFSHKPLSLGQQVALDLEKAIGVHNRQRKIKYLSRKMGIHTKTLLRLSRLDNKPSYLTVFKIYRHLLNEIDDAQVLQKAPPIVRDYLKNANPEKVEKNAIYLESNERIVTSNPIASELFVLSSTGDLSNSEIKTRYGEYGMKALASLLESRILEEIRPGIYRRGLARFNFSPDAIVSMGVRMVDSFAKPKNGYDKNRNFHGFFAEGLTPEAFHEWLKIDVEAFEKKMELAKKTTSFGSIRAYTFISTDTLEIVKSKLETYE